MCVERCIWYGSLVKITGQLAESLISFRSVGTGAELMVLGLSTGQCTVDLYNISYKILGQSYTECITAHK